MTSTASEKSPPKSLRFWYQAIVALLVVLGFFSEAVTFWFDAGVSPPPSLLVMVLAVAILPLLLPWQKRSQQLPWDVFLWCGIYLIISQVSYYLLPAAEITTQELRYRFLAILFIVTSAVLFSGDRRVQTIARWGIVLVIFLNVFNNFTEISNPLAFGEMNASGRPAGYYTDPNKAGCSLILAIILGVTALPIQLRIYFIAIAAVGIFLTFSRGALLSLPIIMAILSVGKILPRKHFWTALLSLVFLFISLNVMAPEIIKQVRYAGLDQNIEKRLETFTNPNSRDANDDTSRLDVVFFALDHFFERPLLGHGIGYTKMWGEIPPHNMYLMMAVEHGLLGVLIYPAFLLLATRNAQGETRYLAICTLTFLLIWGFFSHKILEERYILLSCTLLADMRVLEQRNLEQQQLEQQQKIQVFKTQAFTITPLKRSRRHSP
ncbi:MAG: O-antigen ligase family protein [Synechococcales bacterium]|nr:O-antigen ligase family protein [Synechococcales bacterium]